MTKVNWPAMKVLVAEDEKDLRELLIMVFESRGAQVLAACDGIEALDILQNHTVDIVLSDIRMPRCDGLTLLDTIRNRNAHPPLVFLATGYADIDKPQALQRGAANLIFKPYTIQDLFSSLEKHLEKESECEKLKQA